MFQGTYFDKVSNICEETGYPPSLSVSTINWTDERHPRDSTAIKDLSMLLNDSSAGCLALVFEYNFWTAGLFTNSGQLKQSGSI